MKKVLAALVAFVVVIAATVYFARKHPASPSPPPQVAVTISPNSHIVRLTVTYWTTLQDVDAVVDKFIEQHPELACSGFQATDVVPNSGYPAKFILLCSKVPFEDAQTQTGPP